MLCQSVAYIMYNNMSTKQKKTTPQSKPKLPKSKTVGVKSGIKTVQAKKAKTSKEKSKKSQASPIAEPGYSLYSTDSEDQINVAHRQGDPTAQLLRQLHDRKKGVVSVPSKKKIHTKSQRHPFARSFETPGQKKSPQHDNRVSMYIPTAVQAYKEHQILQHVHSSSSVVVGNPRIPFNIRLASSTPDPEKVLSREAPPEQELPEKDVDVNQRTRIPSPGEARDQNYGIIPQSETERNPVTTPTKRAPPSVLKAQIPYLLGGVGYQYVSASSPREGQGQPWSADFAKYVSETEVEPRRGSHISAFQPYIISETMSNTPPKFLQAESDVPERESNINTADRTRSSLNSGSSEVSKLNFVLEATQESGGTDYFVLPRQPQQTGQQETIFDPRQEFTATYQLQDGLYQIHAAPVYSKPSEKHGPSISSSDGLFGSSQLVHRGQIWEVPEKDTDGNKPNEDDGARSSLGFKVEGATLAEGLVGLGMLSPTVGIPPFKSSMISGNNRNMNMPPVTGKILSHSQNSVPSVNGGGGNTCSQESDISCATTPRNATLPSDHGDTDTFVIGKNPTTVAATQTTLRESELLSGELLHKNNNCGSESTSGAAPAMTVGVKQSAVSGTSGQTDARANVPSYGNPWSKMAVDIGIQRLHYLLSEIKECSKINKDIEVGRLIKELDQTVGSIPQLNPTFNLQTEIDLALQPLRSENSQLRRRLRIVNQQLKERVLDSTPVQVRPRSPDVNFDMIHLQASNAALKKQMQEEKHSKVKMAAELKDLDAAVHKLQAEKHQLLCVASDKETSSLKVRQECLQEVQRLRSELDLVRKCGEGLELKLQASEQETHILQITLQQRDLEINRQQEMIQTMKDGIGDLLQELDQTRQGETSYIQNNSFSIQRLVKLVSGNSVFSPERRSDAGDRSSLGRTPSPNSRRSLSFNKEVSPRLLTRQALTEHNQQLLKTSGSTDDDTTLLESQSNHREKSPQCNDKPVGRHRRTSSASPVDKERMTYKHQRTVSWSPHPSKSRGQTKKEVQFAKEIDSERLLPGKSHWNRPASEKINKENPYMLYPNENDVGIVENVFKMPRAQQKVPKLNLHKDSSSEEQESETDVKAWYSEPRTRYVRQASQDGELLGQSSLNQSRYSVTDYFKKYPESYGSNDNDLRKGPVVESGRGLYPPQQKSSATPKQDSLFQGTDLDVSLSVIDDDNLSSISGTVSSISTAVTVDDRAFRRGMNSLDANIAKLQLSLHKTKQMLGS